MRKHSDNVTGINIRPRMVFSFCSPSRYNNDVTPAGNYYVYNPMVVGGRQGPYGMGTYVYTPNDSGGIFKPVNRSRDYSTFTPYFNEQAFN